MTIHDRRCRVFLLTVSLALTVVSSPLRGADQIRVLFGPERFTRTAGGTTTYNRTFSVPSYVSGPYTLSVVNGGSPDGNGSVPDAVTSASIAIDGQQVVGPNEFSRSTPAIQKSIALSAANHSLQIDINGTPDTFFRLTISGVIHIADLLHARSGHSATLLTNGKVLIAGGNGGGGALASAEVFDPATLTTSALSAELAAARAEHSATLMPDNETLFAGGEALSGVLGLAETGSPSLDAFRLIAATMKISRSGHTATLLHDGRLLILGGARTSGDRVDQNETFDPVHDPLSGVMYDPRTGVFRTIPHVLSVPRTNHTATLMPDGRVLIAGGANGVDLASAEMFDPATGVSVPLASTLAAPRSAHSATLRPDGSVVIAGGKSNGALVSNIEVFDPTTSSFSTASALLSVSRANHTATLLPSGEILIAGGSGANGNLAHTELIGPPASDVAAPRIALIAPKDGAVDVDRTAIIAIRFSEPIDPRSILATTLRLMQGAQTIAGSTAIGESGLEAFFVPAAKLAGGTLFTVMLAGVRDLAGNPLPAMSATFTTLFPPVITGFSPTHGVVGTTVSISGQHFDADITRNLVTVGTTRAVVSNASATNLTITIPDGVHIGPARIAVETPGGRAESTTDFIVDNPIPLLASMNPSQADAGSSGVSVALTGTNFVAGATVNFGGSILPATFVSSTSLSVVIPATELTAARSVPVAVVNPAPGGGASNALLFAVVASKTAVGDFVWHDLDGDGVQDPGEPGLAAVTVRLLNAQGNVVSTTQTAADGSYHFRNVPAGPYIVEFVAPAGFAFTTRDVGADASDSDADPITGRTALITLVSDSEDKTVDAGLFHPLTTLSTSPLSGETNVAVTRETIIRFSNALAPAAPVTVGNLFAEFAGQPVIARIHIAPDRRAVTLFYDRDLPPSARVRVTFIGDGVVDEFGRAVDADGDGVAGGTALIDFDTLTLTTLAGTRVCGRVFASQLAPGALNTSVNTPLDGVTVTVDGLETTLRTVTDNLGNFCLDPAPVGKFFVHIDGRTATAPLPTGDYYPVVGKLWESTAGETVNIGEVYLPHVVAGTLQPVSRTADTPLTFPASVLAQHPELQGVKLTVPADALYSDSGSRGGMVGIAPVPPDRIPGPLPGGLEFPVVITVQTDGASNFDRPVPTCFPNLRDPGLGRPLDPGTKNALYSFDHDTGHWKYVGPMTVSANGLTICTDAGTGILAPGWHGSGPPPTQPPPPKKGPRCQTPPGQPGPPLSCPEPPAQNPPPCQLPPFSCTQPRDLCALWKCIEVANNNLKRCQTECAVIAGPCLYPKGGAKQYSKVCAAAIVLYEACVNLKCTFDWGIDILNCKSASCGPPPPLQLMATSIAFHATSTTDQIIDQIMDLYRQVNALAMPYVSTDQNLPPAIQAQVDALLASADSLAGGDASAYVTSFMRANEEQNSSTYDLHDAFAGDEIPYPILYAAQIQRPGGEMVLRGQTEPFGQYSLFIPRDGKLIDVAFYDPLTKSHGVVIPYLRAGLTYQVPHFLLKPIDTTLQDSDHDGLPDAVEFVYGTDPFGADSDGDGISDGAEVDQGTNPLDNHPVRTGIIATAKTAGPALDVCAVNDMAAVATGAAGVSVFNVFNGMNPTIVAQVDTPGTAQAVACAGNTIAVADGSSGLAIVDITDPPAARVVRQVPLIGTAQAVTVSAGVAYVGLDSGSLVAIDLATGSILQEISGLQAVYDVAIEGDTLFVALSYELRSYRLSPGSLEFLGNIGVSLFPEGITRRRRLFVGGGTAYVTSYPGYDTVDISDPAAMHLVGHATDGGPNSFKQIVANGSGLGVAAVGVNPREDGTHDVWLYDVSNPAVTNRFLTVLPTPGLTRALSIYNGLAYAADGDAGLQVVNYLPYDARGIAPTIQLATNFAPGVAEEGQVMRLTAIVSDDVQVRNVEFFIDGTRIATDGNFPFEYRFVTPLMSQQASFVLNACATDTGGNRTCTTPVTVTLTQDATPPHVHSVSPANGTGAAEGTLSTLSATFTEPIDANRLTTSTFRLFSAGADSLIGTADDIFVSGGTVTYRDDSNTAFLSFAAALPIDLYRAVLSATITDLRGNALPSDYSWTFRVKRPASWINPAGGLWTDPANWSDHTIPAAGDAVYITLPGTYEVIANQSTIVRRLTLGGGSGSQSLWINGNGSFGSSTLTVTEGIVNDGTIRLESVVAGYASSLQVTNGPLTNHGTIRTVIGTGGPRDISGTLDNHGTLDVAANTNFAGTLTSDGTVQVGGGQTLSLAGAQVFTQQGGTLTGSGVVFLSSGATFNFAGGTITGESPLLFNSTLNFGTSLGAANFVMTGTACRVSGTIAPAQSLWLRGQGDSGSAYATAPSGLTNNGIIRLESQDGGYESRLIIAAGALTNRGTITTGLGAGGPRTIVGNVINQGTIAIGFPASLSGTLTNTATIDIATNQALTFGPGDILNLNGGTISGNGVLQLNGSTLNFNGGGTSGAAPRLVNSTLNFGAPPSTATFIMTGTAGRATGTIAAGQTMWLRGEGSVGNAFVTLPAGLTNDGTMRMESIDGGYACQISATGGPLSNRGTITLNRGSDGDRNIIGDVMNQGSINVTYSGAFAGILTNSGAINIDPSQTLSLGSGHVLNLNAGTISGAGQLLLTGSTLNFNAGTTTGSAPLLINSTLNFGTSTGAANFIMTGTLGKVTGTIAANQSLTIRGQGSVGNATVSAPNGLVNNGTIRLETIEGGYAVSLAGQLTNAGAVIMNPGAGGPRVLTGDVNNIGTIEVNADASYGGTLTNRGIVTIATGRSLSISSSQTFDLRGGTIAGAGTLSMNGATLLVNGGNVTGAAPVLVNSSLAFNSQSGTAMFVMTGTTGHVSGTTGANHIVWIRGQGSVGNATLTADDGFTNLGSIRMESVDGGYVSSLAGNFANSGVISANPGSGGPRIISGNVVNTGTINVNTPTDGSGTLTHTGRISIAAGQTFSVSGTLVLNAGSIEGAGTLVANGATLNFNGGTTTGAPPLLINSTLNFGAGNEPATFIMTGGNGHVSGWPRSGQTLWIRGQGSVGNATVSASGSFTNAGTIRLDTIDGGYTATLALTSGLLTNAPTGLIDINRGAGGGRTISASVRNEGAITVDADAGFTSLENASGSVLRGGASITISTGSIANAGTISPGSSPGRLTIGGSLAQQTTGAVNVEISGLSAGALYDQLAVSGGATLDGTLTVMLTGGYEPNIGDSFDVMTFGSRSGTFSTVTGLTIGNGKRFQTNYGPTKVTLVVVPE